MKPKNTNTPAAAGRDLATRYSELRRERQRTKNPKPAPAAPGSEVWAHALERAQAARTGKQAARTADADGTYLLRGIPRELWATFAERAKADGVDMRALLLLIVRGYVDGRIELIASTKGGGL